MLNLVRLVPRLGTGRYEEELLPNAARKQEILHAVVCFCLFDAREIL